MEIKINVVKTSESLDTPRLARQLALMILRPDDWVSCDTGEGLTAGGTQSHKSIVPAIYEGEA